MKNKNMERKVHYKKRREKTKIQKLFSKDVNRVMTTSTYK